MCTGRRNQRGGWQICSELRQSVDAAAVQWSISLRSPSGLSISGISTTADRPAPLCYLAPHTCGQAVGRASYSFLYEEENYSLPSKVENAHRKIHLTVANLENTSLKGFYLKFVFCFAGGRLHFS